MSEKITKKLCLHFINKKLEIRIILIAFIWLFLAVAPIVVGLRNIWFILSIETILLLTLIVAISYSVSYFKKSQKTQLYLVLDTVLNVEKNEYLFSNTPKTKYRYIFETREYVISRYIQKSTATISLDAKAEEIEQEALAHFYSGATFYLLIFNEKGKENILAAFSTPIYQLDEAMFINKKDKYYIR